MLKKRTSAMLAVASVLFVSAAILHLSLSAAVTEPVRVENGLVAGVPGLFPEVRVFKGIPFAAPPIGELRWRAPKPAANWDGVRKADAFSANCMQRAANGGAFPPYGGDRSATRMSEDCLYLNVYTAASSSDKRPVMVWIHGGALTSGAGAIYQGEDLARKGVVVVTVNYRLGVFGFLAHPELTKESEAHASGNYAFLDQIAALKWVQKNIAAFGGDPKRVTIFGESAGSWSVNYLVASPLAHGLFQRAIGESGGEFAPGRTLADAEQAGLKFAESVGASSIAALRAKSADDLARTNGFQAAGNVDGWVLPADVNTLFADGRQNDVPMLIGSNANEGSIFTPASVTAQSFREQAQRNYGADAEGFLKLYPFGNDTEARAEQAASMRDRTFGWEMRTWARMQAKTGRSKAYLYYFSHVPPLPNATWLGAQHGAEIPYAFNWPNGRHSTEVAWTETDKKLADQMSSYWVNFATTGDPNGKGLPKWPAYQTKDDLALGFGDSIAVAAVPNKPALDFLDRYIDRLRQSRPPARSQTAR
jgi:para-nitrobenzyl esterase